MRGGVEPLLSKKSQNQGTIERILELLSERIGEGSTHRNLFKELERLRSKEVDKQKKKFIFSLFSWRESSNNTPISLCRSRVFCPRP